MSDNNDKEVLIPEVLPPEGGGSRQRPPSGQPPPRGAGGTRSTGDRIANALGPILSGLILDLSHIHPGGWAGFIIGAILGFWFARSCNLRFGQCVMVMCIAAFVGKVGLHRFMPIATIAGAWFAFGTDDGPRKPKG